MEINIDVSKPSFTIYHYDGFVTKDENKYCFEIIDRQDDLEVQWFDDYNFDDKSDVEDEIIEKFENIWKQH